MSADLNPAKCVPPSFCGILFVKGRTSSEYPEFQVVYDYLELRNALEPVTKGEKN